MDTERLVRVSPERLRGWVDGFAERHGGFEATLSSDDVTLAAPDGARAVLGVPFLPWKPVGEPVEALVGHVTRERRVGALLVRKGGYAVGRFAGDRLVASKVDSTYVQGRTKAGGWSQQRFARRRDNQSAKAYAETAHVAARLLAPHAADLDAVVGGGDKAAVIAVLADPRLAALRPLLQPRVHPVPDPRLRVLEAFPEQFRAVDITLNALA
jgi:Actinobacteria/chloroflexi VLRF1 release factor